MISTVRGGSMARRKILHDFANTTMPDGDKMFFDTLERCAADNARAITEITQKWGVFTVRPVVRCAS